MSWENYKDKVKRYFPFSKTELKNFALLVLIFAFMWSFTQWGERSFDAAEGFRNFVLAVIIVGVSLFIHHAAQRLYGLFFGFRVEHQIWWTGMLAGLLAVLLSNGQVLIFAASSMRAHFMPSHRLGAFRYGPGLRQMGIIAFSGPVISAVVAFFAYLIAPVALHDFVLFTLLHCLYNMLPIPPLDGLHVFVGTRAAMGGIFWYTFLTSFFIGFFLLYFVGGAGMLLSALLAVIIGFAGWFVFDTLVK
jgi:hypothetical protein